MPADYYELLGVTRSASADEIKRAYRRLAREHHPDANPGDAQAAERFKEVSVAYETLSNPEKRRRYDMFGPERASAGTGPGDAEFGFNDIFEAFFGGDPFGGTRGRRPSGPARGPDSETFLELTLEDVVLGATKTLELRLPVTCSTCDGSGCEPGTHPQTCPTCEGTGEVRQIRRSVLGQVMTSGPCPQCGAEGTIIPNPCEECRGEGRVEGPRTIELDVPAGIADGQRLRLSGRGPAARRGGLPGDLYVGVRVLPHERYERHGDDLLGRMTVSITQAVLGARLEVETFDGTEELVVEPGTQPGTRRRLKGRGVPSLDGGRRGNLIIELAVDVPSRLSDEEADLYRRLAEIRGDDVAPAEQGFFSRIRGAFQ